MLKHGIQSILLSKMVMHVNELKTGEQINELPKCDKHGMSLKKIRENNICSQICFDSKTLKYCNYYKES